MVKLEELRLVIWSKAFIKGSYGSLKKNFLIKSFGFFVTTFLAIWGIDSAKTIPFMTSLQYLVKLFLLTIIACISFPVAFVFLILITILIGWLIYLLIKPWILVYSYEPMLKVMRSRAGLQSPNQEESIKANKVQLSSKDTQKIAKNILEEMNKRKWE